jgi:hypothetical protein
MEPRQLLATSLTGNPIFVVPVARGPLLKLFWLPRILRSEHPSAGALSRESVVGLSSRLQAHATGSRFPAVRTVPVRMAIGSHCEQARMTRPAAFRRARRPTGSLRRAAAAHRWMNTTLEMQKGCVTQPGANRRLPVLRRERSALVSGLHFGVETSREGPPRSRAEILTERVLPTLCRRAVVERQCGRSVVSGRRGGLWSSLPRP